MSRWKHIGCPKCGSSDALSFKEGDEWGKCFSCGKSTKLDGSNEMELVRNKQGMMEPKKLNLMDIGSYDTRGFKERGITKTVSEHYGVKVAYAEDGTIESHFYPYTIKGEVVAYKERKLPKKFLIHGDFKGAELFGQSVSRALGKRIIITEGELDCMAVAQAQYEKYNKFYPVVALPSASQTSVALEQREWLRTFEEVILMLDQDEPGRKASEQLAKIIGFDKIKVAKLPEKDPCDVLIKHGSQVLMNCVFDAQAYNPSGVVRGEEIWERYKVKESVVSTPYPSCLESLNSKIKGIRMGEITLFTSGTGSGKSTVIKEIVLELLKNPEAMVGMVSLEESIGDTAEKFIGMQLRKNLTEDLTVTEEEKREAFDQIFGDNRLVLLDHQGSVSDESLIDKMEYLALIGCKYIILDHITIAVSEGVKGKTGNEAIDSFMSDLLKITKKHDIWLGVISHLRKGDKPFEEGHLPSIDDIKGSGSIKQISFDIIAFARNMVAATPEEQNTIKLRVLKSRFTGKTGDCGNTRYNPLTTRLEPCSMIDL
jgi:twinkle protein